MLSNMKYVIYLLLGVICITILAPRVEFQKVKSLEIAPIANSELKAEEVKEPVKDANKTEEVIATPPPVDVVKENPNKCDQATEWIYPDGTCHKKAGDSIAPETIKPATSGGCEAVYSYSGWDQRVAYAVCMGESGGNANAYNPEAHNGCNGSRGLFQIACVHSDSTFDPTGNINAAIRIYNSSGWKPWGAFTSGKYLKYL